MQSTFKPITIRIALNACKTVNAISTTRCGTVMSRPCKARPDKNALVEKSHQENDMQKTKVKRNAAMSGRLVPYAIMYVLIAVSGVFLTSTFITSQPYRYLTRERI